MYQFIFLFLLTNIYQADDWHLLSDVALVRKYDNFLSQEVDVPVFSVKLRRKEGEEITLEGYVIPLETAKNQYFVLSRFPFQSCFFCGAAGPETVVEVYGERSFSVFDQRVRVTGELQLNDGDPLHLFYILKNASVELIN